MRLPLIIVALSLASAARADTIAIYASPADVCSMTVKIASNGDVRADVTGNIPGVVTGRTHYFVGGRDYFVDDGPVVMRLEDIEKVLGEQIGNLGHSSFPAPSLTLVPRGAVSINKWSGDAYYMQASGGQLSARPVTVISHDPSLAQLGRAMARQFATSEKMMSQITDGHAPKTNMDQVLSSGAPISFAGAELQAVTFGVIPKEDFNLPGPPASLDEVRKRMTPKLNGAPVTTSKGQKPEVGCHIVVGG
jgi:hypothetical protein